MQISKTIFCNPVEPFVRSTLCLLVNALVATIAGFMSLLHMDWYSVMSSGSSALKKTFGLVCPQSRPFRSNFFARWQQSGSLARTFSGAFLHIIRVLRFIPKVVICLDSLQRYPIPNSLSYRGQSRRPQLIYAGEQHRARRRPATRQRFRFLSTLGIFILDCTQRSRLRATLTKVSDTSVPPASARPPHRPLLLRLYATSRIRCVGLSALGAVECHSFYQLKNLNVHLIVVKAVDRNFTDGPESAAQKFVK